MPRSSAALTSIEALRSAVEAMRRSLGSRSMIARVRGVRARITHPTSNGRSRPAPRPPAPRVRIGQMVVEHGDRSAVVEHGPIRQRKGDVLVVIQNGDAEAFLC